MLVYLSSNSPQMLGFCKPPCTVPKCHPSPSNLSRILKIPCLYALMFCPLCPEIRSIKNSPALRAATSTGSILDEESYLNSQRLETCVSVILWVSRSCMEYLSLLIPPQYKGQTLASAAFRASHRVVLTTHMSVQGTYHSKGMPPSCGMNPRFVGCPLQFQ